MNKLFIPVVLSFMITGLVMYAVVQHKPVDTVVYYNQDGCTISLTTEFISDVDTLYTVTYDNTQTGESHTEVETRQVDAEYMVNLFQDWCNSHHN